MQTSMKLFGLVLFTFGVMATANAQVSANVQWSYNSGQPELTDNIPAPVYSDRPVYVDRPAPVVYNNDRRVNGEVRHEVRDIRRDKEELQRQFQIANSLNERIRYDYSVGDRTAAHFDRERLERTNRIIHELQEHIERDEREIRHEIREHRELEERRDNRW